jgi:DNA-binding NarL/FixJ family response regulator
MPSARARWQYECVQLRCVIVDDDERFLRAARTSLERGGTIVAGVADSRATAVQRVRALRPDVVLIDIRLDTESGFDVANELAARGCAAALIMISTHAEADYEDVIAESPVAGFLHKTELSAEAIRRVLGLD